MSMRGFGLGAFAAAAFLMLLSLVSAEPAEALWGETCRDEVVVRGAVSRSHGGAIDAAIRAWGPAAAKRYGRRFADYHYSGERQFNCTWNDAGTRYRCTLSARPCGSKKSR
jgi:hypothetical protein